MKLTALLSSGWPFVVGPSEDSKQFRLRRAAADFLYEVRQTQATSGKVFSGRNRLAPRQQYAIRNAANASALVAAVKESTGAILPLHNLFERFEEMCRRQNVAVDAELRPALVEILAGELFANHRSLYMAAEKLMGLTVRHGAIGPDLVKEFPEFHNMPCVIRQAARNYPSAPRAFLRKVSEDIDTLVVDSEFGGLHDTPGMFARAVLNYSDPHGFLRKKTKQKGEP